ncbi:MAG TPA: DUF6492 family protein [Plantibacter sp.]|uniref:DUF6492 family protein n=1 Tax=unclassified Plantibacter TaxID=2624265 RepID=UPI002BA3912A|nr:DUF6492 family protein [Plantibacter sp.]
MDTNTSPVAVTFVTVVFEPELELLRLQARSIARYVAPEIVDSIVVIDNTVAGLRPRARRRLTEAYGSLALKLDIVRPSELLADPVAASGWRVQQALKLLIADRIATDWYLVLDAKTVFISPTAIRELFTDDGRPLGGVHSYEHHPLLPQLRTVIAYAGLDPDPLVGGFTSTATPFLLSTEAVRSLVGTVGSRHPQGFSAEFESAGLTEFFLYTASRLADGEALGDVVSGDPLESPTVWPRHRSGRQVQAVLDDARTGSATTMAVHRTALARMDRAGVAAVSQFWVERGLFPSTAAAKRFIATYRARYFPAMAVRRLRIRFGRKS